MFKSLQVLNSVIATTLPRAPPVSEANNASLVSHVNQHNLKSITHKLTSKENVDFQTAIDSALEDFTVSVTGENVNLTIYDPNGKCLNNLQSWSLSLISQLL